MNSSLLSDGYSSKINNTIVAFSQDTVRWNQGGSPGSASIIVETRESSTQRQAIVRALAPAAQALALALVAWIRCQLHERRRGAGLIVIGRKSAQLYTHTNEKMRI